MISRQVKIYIHYVLVFTLITFNHLFPASEILLQKINENALASSQVLLSQFMGDSCKILSQSGQLYVAGQTIDTKFPFILNQDVSWQFTFSITFNDDALLYNYNPMLNWYFSTDEGLNWKPINSSTFRVSGNQKYLFKFSYQKNDLYNPLELVQPQFSSGFWVPVFYQVLKPVHLKLLNYQKIDQRCIFQAELTDSSLIGKNLFFTYVVNGKKVRFNKIFNKARENLVIALPLSSALHNQTNQYELTFYLTYKRTNMRLYRFRFTTDDFQYQAPHFLLDQEKFQVRAIRFVPSFEFANAYFDPKIFSGILAGLKQQGFNTVIVDSRYFSPIFVQLVRNQGLFVISDHSFIPVKRLSRYPEMLNSLYVAGSIFRKSPAGITIPESHLIFKRFFIRANSLSGNTFSRNTIPVFSLIYLDQSIYRPLLNIWKSTGGLLEYNDVGYTFNDSLRLQYNPVQSYINLHNYLKEKSNVPTSYVFGWINPFLNKVPVNQWTYESNFLTPPSVMVNQKGFQFLNFQPLFKSLNSNLPVYEDLRLPPHRSGIIFVSIGILTLFLFIFYLKSLKPFQVYFSKALRRNRSFIMDLNEKIAVPWNETLLLNLLISLGLSVVFGSILYLYSKHLIFNFVINILLINPAFSTLVLKIFSSPYKVILLIILLYWLYLFILTFIVKFGSLVFRRTIRLKYAFALVSWTHILFSFFIPVALISYNTILQYSATIYFIYGFIILWIFSFMKLINGMKISLGVLKSKIHLFFGLIFILFVVIIYLSNYPVYDIWDAFIKFKGLYF